MDPYLDNKEARHEGFQEACNGVIAALHTFAGNTPELIDLIKQRIMRKLLTAVGLTITVTAASVGACAPYPAWADGNQLAPAVTIEYGDVPDNQPAELKTLGGAPYFCQERAPYNYVCEPAPWISQAEWQVGP